jgi:hypothetical protein
MWSRKELLDEEKAKYTLVVQVIHTLNQYSRSMESKPEGPREE